MASNPLQRVSLHVVAEILTHLDSFKQLGLAILSHRVFHNALHDNLHYVARSIITNQISDVTLPFALVLLKSARLSGDDHDGIRNLLDHLITDISEPCHAAAALINLSLDEYAILSKNHAAVESLRDDFSREAIPAFVERFELEHAEHLNPQEKFRLDRAFYRYQIMCNLYCGRKGFERNLSPIDRRYPFFSEFSPWVNEQLICVYYYLENKVVTGMCRRYRVSFQSLTSTRAYDEIAAHDVVWGGVPVKWRRDPEELGLVQSYVSYAPSSSASSISQKLVIDTLAYV